MASFPKSIILLACLVSMTTALRMRTRQAFNHNKRNSNTNVYIPSEIINQSNNNNNNDEIKENTKDVNNAPVTILHVTDLHGWIAGHQHLTNLDADYGDFSSFVDKIRPVFKNIGRDLLIFDTGDLIEGTGISDAIPGGYHGEFILPIVSKISFDGLTNGNHDLGHDEVIDAIDKELEPVYDGGYLTANTYMKSSDSPLGGSFKVLETTFGKKVVVMGFIYNFQQAADEVTVVDVQKALKAEFFTQAMAVEDVDFVIVLNHIAPQVQVGSEDLLADISAAIRAAKPETPIVLLSGHSHVEDFKWYDNNSFTIESGKYFEEIGRVDFTLNATNGALTNASFTHQWIPTSRENFYSLTGVYPPHFLTETGKQIKTQIAELQRKLELNKVEGCSPITYETRSPLDRANSSYRLLIEDIAPKVLFDYSLPNIQFFVSSTGFLRYDLYKGPVTKNDVWTMCGFNDSYAYFPGVNGALLGTIISNLEGLPPAMIRSSVGKNSDIPSGDNSDRAHVDAAHGNSHRHGCTPGVAGGKIPAPGPVHADTLRGLPDALPYFVYSYKTVRPDAVYDVICNSYDAGTINLVLDKIYSLEGDHAYGQPRPKNVWYPNTISDTFMIRDYVRKYMPCDASTGPESNPRVMMAKGDTGAVNTLAHH